MRILMIMRWNKDDHDSQVLVTSMETNLMDELGVKACTPAFKDTSSVAVASGENFIFK